MRVVVEQLLILYVFLFLGWLLGRLKKEQAAKSGLLSLLIVNVFLPCKIFLSLSSNFTVSYIKEKYQLVLFSLVFLLLIVAVVPLVARLFAKRDYEKQIYRYSLTLSNYSYMGYVLVESLFGAAGLIDQILFCIPFALYTYTFGFWMLTNSGKSLRRMVNPLIISMLAGILFGLCGWQLPTVVTNVLNMGSACVGVTGMLLTGLVLSAFPLKKLFTDKIAYIVVALRLVVIPAAVFGVCRLFGFSTIIVPAVFMACMPCALNTVIFPGLIGEDATIGARLALISHLLSVVTIPLWMMLVT